MTYQDIEQSINTFFVDTLEYDASAIAPNALLKDDLGMTSLDAVETRVFIFKHFNFQPQKQDMLSLKTLQDLYNYIYQHQQP